MQKKYDVLGVVGEGAYGIVYKCRNKETGKYVAIKKFKEIEDKLVQKTMKRELKMLQMLRHDNVVDFQEAFIYKGNLFLVFEYVEKNLLEVLEKSPDGLNPKLIRSFVFQMCKAVHYLHINNMIHRDVKPENLLIDENMQLKLCDFGFARKIKLNEKNNNVDAMTDYVATRWYRSPELLLSNGIYGPEVDYWAIGCIMGELADGNPMFPGENEVDQLECIIKILGNLPSELVNMFYENPIYNGKELLKVNRPESLERRYRGALGPTAIDFLKGLLQLDPNKRLNDETVFKHKYFACFMKEPENQYILDYLEKENNLNNTSNNNSNKIDNIKKAKSNSEIEDNNINKIQTNVINNTTNINIINYNNYNSTNNKNINNENENSLKKNKDKKLENNESKKSITLTKNNASSKNINFNNNNENRNSNPNILEENNKKSLSVNKNNKIGKFGNMTIYNNFGNVKLISLSQGKTNQKNKNSNNNTNTNNNNTNTNTNTNTNAILNNNTNNNNIKNSTQNSFNIKKINIYGSNYISNNSNSNIKTNNLKNLNNNYNNNDMLALVNANLDGYKTFFNLNKSKDKYNFKINTGYVKEEGKKYANQNINLNNNNVIDENDEYLDFNTKKKSTSKEHKKNGQLLIKYSDNYKYNFNNFNNKNGGYGTFYKYNMKNTNFGGFNKKKNSPPQLPQLFKLHNNGNGSNHKNKFNNKNKFKYY